MVVTYIGSRIGEHKRGWAHLAGPGSAFWPLLLPAASLPLPLSLLKFATAPANTLVASDLVIEPPG